MGTCLGTCSQAARVPGHDLPSRRERAGSSFDKRQKGPAERTPRGAPFPVSGSAADLYRHGTTPQAGRPCGPFGSFGGDVRRAPPSRGLEKKRKKGAPSGPAFRPSALAPPITSANAVPGCAALSCVPCLTGRRPVLRSDRAPMQHRPAGDRWSKGTRSERRTGRCPLLPLFL